MYLCACTSVGSECLVVPEQQSCTLCRAHSLHMGIGIEEEVSSMETSSVWE